MAPWGFDRPQKSMAAEGGEWRNESFQQAKAEVVYV